MVLGCVADDFTGATDLASTLVHQGMRAIVWIDSPQACLNPPPTDAFIIALKSRTLPARQAVRASLAALRWLRAAGARQFFFKYCSTFDSTDAGNIGPVADALLDELGERFTIVCPAFPENGRTVYQGHLFVGDRLLSESSMRHHPLTPMTDPDVVRVLGRQTPARVGLVPYDVVRRGPEAISVACGRLRDEGVRYAVIDAVEDGDLQDIASACHALALITGASGVARGLPASFRRVGLLGDPTTNEIVTAIGGHAAVLAGSCSAATLAQVDEMRGRRPAFVVDPKTLAAGRDVASETLQWAQAHLQSGPVLIYSSAPPADVRQVQATLGQDRVSALVEGAMAAIARGLVASGVRRLVIAGGETAGAVVAALGVHGLRIGRQIDPGVPWTLAMSDPPIALALKSGNFGDRRFFLRALEMTQ